MDRANPKPKNNSRENQNVIVIGATNLKNVIDPALLRPGRFDLTIDVPHPSKEGREEILNYYFSKGTVRMTFSRLSDLLYTIACVSCIDYMIYKL